MDNITMVSAITDAVAPQPTLVSGFCAHILPTNSIFRLPMGANLATGITVALQPPTEKMMGA